LQFFIILSVTLVIGVSQIDRLPVLTLNANYYEFILALFLIIAAVVVVKARTLLLSVVALGTIGFLTTLVFLIYSAPDVAMTQLLVETLVVVFIAIVLRYLPRARSVPKHSKPRLILNALIACTIGTSVGIILWLISATALNPQIAEFYAQTSVSGGHGRNIVNVILVDFRAFDTMGEAIVVIIAALATVAALGRKKHGQGKQANT
jgi:multicomponent Na+:H+ antiporter subunit A